MRRLVLAAAVLVGAVAVWTVPAAAQEEDSEHGIGFPPEWNEWDENGNGQLDTDELTALTPQDWDAFKNWAQSQLNQNGGNFTDRQMRDWVRRHADSDGLLLVNSRERLGIAAEGNLGGDHWDDVRGSAVDAVTGIPGAIADSAFGAIANAVGEAAGDLVGRVGEVLAPVGDPTELESDWYRPHYSRMLGWMGLIMLPLAMVAIGSAVLRGETAKVGETLLAIPMAFLLAVAAIGLVRAAGGLATAMSDTLASDIRDSSTDLGGNVAGVLSVQAGVMGPGLVLLLGLVIALAALVTLVWLILAEAAIYATVLFVPLAFAGKAWPDSPAAGWGRKLMTLAFALVFSKVVIFALWALTVDGLADATGAGDVSLNSAVAIGALMLLTALSPVAVLRMVPMVEGAQAAGDPRGVQMAATGARLGSQGARLSGGLAGSGGGGGGSTGGGRLPVFGGSQPSRSWPGGNQQSQSWPGGAKGSKSPPFMASPDGGSEGRRGRRGGSETLPPGTETPDRRGSGGEGRLSGDGRGRAGRPFGSGVESPSPSNQAPPVPPPGTGDGKPRWRPKQ